MDWRRLTEKGVYFRKKTNILSVKISREFIISRIFSPGHIHTSRPSTGTTNAPKQRPFRVTDDSRKWTFIVFVQTFGQHNCDSVKAYEKGKSLITV